MIKTYNLSFILCLFFLCAGFTQAQWYFETAIDDAKFSNYENIQVQGNPTELNTFSGLRDFSYGVGYLFPFKNIEKRAAENAKTFPIRLSLGIGFDQMNIKTNAVFTGGTSRPVDYNLAQLQGKVGLHFALPLLVNAAGITTLQLDLEGGLAYNMFTNAVQSYGNTVVDLRAFDKFKNEYPAYLYGGGLSLALSKHTRLYGKFLAENAFGLSENNVPNETEDYSVHKRKAVIGVIVDFKLKRKLKKALDTKVNTLQTEFDQHKDDFAQRKVDDSLSLANVMGKILDLKDELERHDHGDQIDDKVYDVLVNHYKGVIYFPDFKHVLFPFNSSYFEEVDYTDKLQKLADFLHKNPDLRLKLVGYADGETGGKIYNALLSQRRANRVQAYLVDQLGVNPDRVQSIGAGETLQFSISELDENRRVEILILN